MKKKITPDEYGQSALFDAVMFLLVMIIASSIISIYSGQSVRDMEISEQEVTHAYCRETAEVVLGATLNSTWYEDINRNIIIKPPGETKVLSLIMEELYLLDEGVPNKNFVLGYEQDVKTLIRNLITSSYHFALQGHYKNESKYEINTIFISDMVPDYLTKEEAKNDQSDYSKTMPTGNLVSTQLSFPMIGKTGEAIITFSIWR